MTNALGKHAKLSSCGTYRYSLTRRWSQGALLPFIMLNPSMADAESDDKTINRCIGFAQREGYAGIIVANLFALRSPFPKQLQAALDPHGPENRKALMTISRYATANGTPIVCAWGGDGKKVPGFADAVALIRQTSKRLVCFKKNNDGTPKHPLYVNGNKPLEPF